MSRKKLIITAIVLVLILAIGGILAYFTDVETKTNKFKMGGANITVTEPSWPNPDPDDPVDIVPGLKVAKDPIVTNVGDGEVYAFVEVTIPKETVKIGTQTTASLQELFTTQYISTPAVAADPEADPPVAGSPAVYTNGINPAWVQLGEATEIAATGTEPAKVKYTYAYGTKSGSVVTLTPLSNTTGSNATPAVFDQVTFADVKEDSTTPAANSIQGKNYEVVVTGYGIQTDGLDTTDAATIFGYAKNNQ